MRAIPALAVAVLAAAAPAAAAGAGLLDRAAPELAVKAWVVGEPLPPWGKLAGRAALLELTDPDELVSQGMISRTAEIAARCKGKPILVATVCCGGGGDPGSAKALASSGKVTWSLGADDGNRVAAAYGWPSFPYYFLVLPDGKVGWQGSSGALKDEVLDDFVARTRLWRTAEIAKFVRPAAELFVKGQYGKAMALAEKGVADAARRRAAQLPVEGDEEGDLVLIRDAVAALAKVRIAQAEALAEDRESLAAQEMYLAMEAAFAGTEWEGKARAGREKLEAHPRFALEIDASKRLREILVASSPPTRRNLEKTVEALDVFVRLYDGLVCAEKAKASRERFKDLLAPKKRE
jgi:hypothetical protein